MLASILANLALIYGLLISPVLATNKIDASNFEQDGTVEYKQVGYINRAPYKNNPYSAGIKITAGSALVIDVDSGQILWEKNANQARPLASITKLMTALVFLDNNPGWQTEVTIQESDYREGGTWRVFKGEVITAQDLFKAALVASSNNSTIALARSTGLSLEEFVDKMNQKAEELGLRQTKFYEPTGLDPNNVSSASDIIKLASLAFSQPEIQQATSLEEVDINVVNVGRSHNLKNTDWLLSSYLEVVAGKTGYLDEAGYCFVSQVSQNKHNLLVVVLGSESEYTRFQEVKALAQWTFDNYTWPN